MNFEAGILGRSFSSGNYLFVWTPRNISECVARGKLNAAETKAAVDALGKFPPVPPASWTSRLPAFRAGYNACGGDASLLRGGTNAK
jgi:hypothetical protein